MHPDKVNITIENTEDGLLINLDVAPEDKGRVIGKQGRTAEEIRALLRAKGTRQETKVRLQIL